MIIRYRRRDSLIYPCEAFTTYGKRTYEAMGRTWGEARSKLLDGLSDIRDLGNPPEAEVIAVRGFENGQSKGKPRFPWIRRGKEG